MTAQVQSIFAAGRAFHQEGLVVKAQEKYRQVLKLAPTHFDALRLLGEVALQNRNPVAAVEWLGRAIAVNGDHAAPHYLRGLALKALGQFDAAVGDFDKAIDLKPDYADAHYQRGLTLLDAGQYEAALASLTESLALKPDSAEAYFHCALALVELQQPMALPCFDKAIELKPDFVAAYFSRGLAFQHAGNNEAALASYLACLANQFDHVEALNNMGNVLRELKRFDASLQSLDQSIALNPGYAAAYYNRGLTLHTVKRYQAALEDYSKCIDLMPDLAVAHNNRGLVLLELKRYDEALQGFDRAIVLNPDGADAHNNRGLLLLELKRYDDATRCFDRAIALNPGDADAYNNRGLVLLELKQYAEAMPCFEQAIVLNPVDAGAYNNLGFLLHKGGHFEAAEAAYRQALKLQDDHGKAAGMAYHCANALCAWEGRRDDETRLSEMVENGGQGLSVFNLLTISDPKCCDAPEFQRRAAQTFAAGHFPELRLPPLVEPTSHPQRQRLHIGYLSADFYGHATMYLLQGVFAHHDRSRFAIHGYSYGSTGDDVTAKAIANFEFFSDLKALSSVDAASLIAADGIDILIDLKGYTNDNRLEITALRPAPLIVSWLGYPGTLGHCRLADYLIGDPVVTPAEHACYYSETLALMPHCYQPNDSQRAVGNNPGRAAEGLPEKGFVFCSFNQSYKFDPDTFSLWCDLLNAVPDSVLWLLSPTAAAITNLEREAGVRCVSPERIVFAPAKPLKAHLGRLQLADLALDTFPVTSHTTASDALWAGVPLVTRIGDSFVSRVAASLLSALDLSELVTESREGYYDLAKALALDSARLKGIRAKLWDRRLTSPLFDTEGFTKDLEALFLRIWEQHAQGKKAMVVVDDSGAHPVEGRKTTFQRS